MHNEGCAYFSLTDYEITALIRFILGDDGFDRAMDAVVADLVTTDERWFQFGLFLDRVRSALKGVTDA